MSSLALRWAANYGHTECVRLLIPVSHPADVGSQALRWAAMEGHAECVRLLIPVSDPKVFGSEALRYAALNGHLDCVQPLVPVSEPGVVKEVCRELRAQGRCHEAAVLELVMAAIEEEAA
jgi:hypothetical protein